MLLARRAGATVARHRWLRFAPAVLVAFAMRLRFVGTPITSDEGGFLAIGRAWSRGAELYRDVWVDRPQGLPVLFRWLQEAGLGTPEGVRALGIVACVVGSIACGLAADELFGRRAGGLAAFFVAALTSVPQYEGFITNGELLSGSVGAIALAIALRATWNRDEPDLARLLVAGAVGGLAFSLKQSGFDAFTCAIVAVGWRIRAAGWSTRGRRLALPSLAVGYAMPLTAMALHGALSGWHEFWYAVAGYRLEQRSALTGANWARLRETWEVAAPVIAPVVAGVLAGLVLAVRTGHRAAVVVSCSWLVAASAAFVSGGQFHRHYWVILAFPLGTIVAGTLAMTCVRWSAVVAAALLAWAPTRMTLDALDIPREQVANALNNDNRPTKDEHIALWFARHADPGDEIYAFCASAGLYGNVATDPPFPYLWLDNVQQIPDGSDRLVEMLSSPVRPRFVAMYQSAATCDASGRAATSLEEHYRKVATIDGKSILERRQS